MGPLDCHVWIVLPAQLPLNPKKCFAAASTAGDASTVKTEDFGHAVAM